SDRRRRNRLRQRSCSRSERGCGFVIRSSGQGSIAPPRRGNDGTFTALSQSPPIPTRILIGVPGIERTQRTTPTKRWPASCSVARRLPSAVGASPPPPPFSRGRSSLPLTLVSERRERWQPQGRNSRQATSRLPG